MKNEITLKISKVGLVLTFFLTYTGAIELARGELIAAAKGTKNDSVRIKSHDTTASEIDTNTKPALAHPSKSGVTDAICCIDCGDPYNSDPNCLDGCDPSCVGRSGKQAKKREK